jgi:putative hemolysin
MDVTAEMRDAPAFPLEVRLAESKAEIDAAFRLRYRVFYEEMGARPTPEMAAIGADSDEFDEVCDHLLVIDRDRGPGPEAVVGTYRLMLRERGEAFGRFYTASEYDISRIIAYPGRIMELGRSCVDAAYRTRSTMQMLWRGIATYVMDNNVDLMFGCASLPGTDPQVLAVPLSFLAHNHMAPDFLLPRALPERYIDMRLLAPEEIDAKQALLALPPLVKGYLRLGGWVGDGAVIDAQFNTTDVCVMVKTDRVSDKYFKHYDRATKEVRS